MKFSEIPYERPNIANLKARMDDRIEQMEQSGSYRAAETVFLAMQKLTSAYETAYSLVSIRHSLNTNDEFYAAEMDFFDNIGPEMEAYAQRWNRALVDNPYRDRLEMTYGKLMFRNAELALKSFSPEIIPECQRENALSTEYQKLIASAQISFEGQTYTISQMSPFKQALEDDRRLAAWKAEASFYKEHSEELNRIYDEMVHLRDTMGKKLGYDGYTQLGYYRMGRNCYDKSDIERFRDAVRTYLVPLAARIYQKQAERIGKSYPMNFADNALTFRSGNPRMICSSEELLRYTKEFYHNLSPETAEFIDFMYENELLDLESRPGKAGGGYCTSLPDYRSPFVFANFNGTNDDIEVVTHELGHAFANYRARKIVPLEYQWPTMEACEVHSMSMEFFGWEMAPLVFGDDTPKFLYNHLADALTFIPYGTMVDHFQHIIYEQPDLTPAERHDVWRKLLGEYMPWIKLDDEIPFYGEGQGWQRQMHIYENPFYYIDYCLAETAALQFWTRIQQDRAAAWDTYMAYTRPAGTKTFLELLKGAGLDSPFEEKALREICETASHWLDTFDLSSLK